MDNAVNNVITVSVRGNDPYDVVIESDFAGLGKRLLELFGAERKLCVIADKNVSEIYGDELVALLKNDHKDVDIISLELGETHKTIETAQKCYSFMIERKYGRKDVVIALGGGICGDLAGFVAATYMRGIAFVQVPTTLLSMVDSSSGGKTGVNFEDYKNMIGAFKMPSLVYINTSTLKTLNDREYASGMAEILKAGLIRDGIFYEWLINNFMEINDREDEYVREMIAKSVNIKKMYVEKDPFEQGERAILNLGHTVGHALEKYTDFKYSHGECVALGTVAAAYLSYKRDCLTMEEYYEIRDMFVPFSLPISLENIDIDRVLEYMRSDKKNVSGKIRFILLKKIGKGIICEEVTDDELREAIGQINFDPND
ncbi:MAG: 3-dehydroquinate synthase [Lachnospiraceae bacterium]|nr:3-dehydroquinate synthase [Lachnospiraceae bacterium]